MTPLEIYTYFGLPLIFLGMGFGLYWWNEREARKPRP
jgi:hypothetical protein